MLDIESAWRGIVLVWSLSAAASLSLTWIMYRAATADQERILSSGRNGELALLGRRVVRSVGARLLIAVTYVLASGTLWAVPEPARGLSDLIVRMTFVLVFAASSVVLFVIALRDLLDTLDLLRQKPLPPHETPPPSPSSPAGGP